MKKILIFFIFMMSISSIAHAETATATFAGGCFWCMEPPFDKLDGVISTTSGYTGGHIKNPSYKQVSKGGTGHYEVVQIKYDPTKVTYQQLLDVYWQNVDPFDNKGQFCDKGTQYLAAIFVHNEEQKELAQKSKQDLQEKIKNKSKIVTEILPAQIFYPAEDYHQDYYTKNPIRYNYYRYGCGRDHRLEEVKQIIWPENP